MSQLQPTPAEHANRRGQHTVPDAAVEDTAVDGVPDGPVHHIAGEVLVRCDGVGRTYGRGEQAVVAVHAVTCSVARSSRVALTGPSGSGKSTLLHLMAGLDDPTSGSIDWPAWHGSPFGRPECAGIVYQNDSLVPNLSALENVALPLLARGTAPSASLDRARRAMEMLGIESVAHQTPDELSGGQAQSTAVARVITMRPTLILADEPTGKLDSLTARHVIDLLQRVSDHLDAGLVISTHDPEVAHAMETIWQLSDGELAARNVVP